MERLTEWRGEHAAIVNHHENYIDRLAAYEDTGLEPGDIEIMKAANDEMRRSEESRVRLFYGTAIGIQAERCAEIVKAETDCRLVVLPCKVGDTVWGVVYDTRDCPNCVGIGGCFGCSKANPIDVYRTDFKLHMVEEIGRTLFLTRAEAEAAMKGVSEDA